MLTTVDSLDTAKVIYMACTKAFDMFYRGIGSYWFLVINVMASWNVRKSSQFAPERKHLTKG